MGTEPVVWKTFTSARAVARSFETNGFWRKASLLKDRVDTTETPSLHELLIENRSKELRFGFHFG
jgi:hypothetical protein